MKAKQDKKMRKWLRENREGFAEYNRRIEKHGLFGESIRSIQAKFDEQLASLRGPDGARKLRAAIRSPAKLRGRVNAETKE